MSNGENAPAEKTKKKSGIGMIILDIVVIVAIIGVVWVFFFYTPPEETVVLDPANVELYRFSDLKGWTNETNETLNVEIWLKNTGEAVARDINLFVRCRNQGGTILYTDVLDLTWELLGDGETCSATYVVDYEPGDTCIETTIELRWDQGMNSYLKETDLSGSV